MQKNVEAVSRTFTSFSGADIVATFHGRVIGEIQAISYTIEREVAPVYTMGSPDPRSFSRGKRGIAGSLIFAVFDRDALMEEMKKDYNGAPNLQAFQQFIANIEASNTILSGLRATARGYGIEDWDERMTRLGYGQTSEGGQFNADNLTNFYMPQYADQLLPFNISIFMANEYGAKAGMEIYDVQILNEGSGFSVDDIVAAKAYSFVARKIKPIEPKESSYQSGEASANFINGDSFAYSRV